VSFIAERDRNVDILIELGGCGIRNFLPLADKIPDEKRVVRWTSNVFGGEISDPFAVIVVGIFDFDGLPIQRVHSVENVVVATVIPPLFRGRMSLAAGVRAVSWWHDAGGVALFR